MTRRKDCRYYPNPDPCLCKSCKYEKGEHELCIYGVGEEGIFQEPSCIGYETECNYYEKKEVGL